MQAEFFSRSMLLETKSGWYEDFLCQMSRKGSQNVMVWFHFQESPVQQQPLKMLIWILKLQVERLCLCCQITEGYECANSCCFMTCCPVQLKIVTPSNFALKWISWYGRLDSMCTWSEGVLVELSLLCTLWEFRTFFGNIEDSILVYWWILMSFNSNV